MKRTFRWLLGLFLVGLVGGWFVLTRMDGLLRSRLEEAVTVAMSGRYTVIVGSLGSEPLKGSVTLRDVSLEPKGDAALRESGFALRVQADLVSLEGLSYWAILVNRNLRVEAVRVIAPHVEYLYAEASARDSARADSASTRASAGKGSIGEIELRDASGLMRRVDRENADLSIADLDIMLRDLRLGRTESSGARWQLGSAEVDLHGLRAALPPLYDAEVDTLNLAYPACTAEMRGARIVPRADRVHYGALVEESTELFDIAIHKLAVRGVDMDALLHDRAVRVRKVEAQGGHLFLDHDGRLPSKPDRPRMLPRSGLASMGAKVSVDSLAITLDAFHYGDRGAKADGYGDIDVEQPHVIATHLRTRAPTDLADTLSIGITGKLYGQGPIDGRFRSAYSAVDDRFRITVMLGAMDFPRFGALTRDMLKAAPIEGRLQELVMRMEGNDKSANVDFLLRYSGLRLEVLPAEGLKGKLISSIANLVVMDANPSPGKDERRVRAMIPRRKDRTIAAYIVGGLKEGVVRTLLPGKLAEAAMERAR